MNTLELEIRDPDGRTERRQLAPGRYRIGREVGEFLIGHPSISGHHADLEVAAQQIVITDANSTNGTFAPGGAKLSAPYTLLAGQAVRLGECHLTWLAPRAVVGGTQVMPQVPAPGRTELMSQVTASSHPPASAAPRPRVIASLPAPGAAPAAAAPPAMPAISISGKAALVLGVMLVGAVGLYVASSAGSGKAVRYDNYEFSYKCWQNVFGIFVSKSRCEANVDGTVLVNDEIGRYKQKLFNDGWELVTATESDIWTTMHFRREKR